MADETPTPESETKPDRAAMLLEGQDFDEETETEAAPATKPETPAAPVAQATETPATPEAPAETIGQPPSFLDRLAELGFEGVETEQDAQERLIESYRQLNERYEATQGEARQFRDLAEYGNEYLKLARDPAFQEYQSKRPQPAPADSAKPESWWSPPAFDPHALQRYREVRVDPATGERTAGWKEGTPTDVKLAAEQYQAYVEKWVDDISTRPHEVLPKIIESEFERLFESKYGEKVREQSTEQFLTQLERDNAEWLYQKDPRTNQTARDASGLPVMTYAGQRVMGHVAYADEQLGINNPRAQWEYAIQMHELAELKAQHGTQNSVATAQQTRDEKRAAHLQRGAAIPDRSGSVPLAEDPHPKPQNGHVSAGRQLLAQLQADGAI